MTWSYDADKDGAFDRVEWARMEWEGFWLGKGSEKLGAQDGAMTTRQGYVVNSCGGRWTASCLQSSTLRFALKDTNCDGIVTYAEADVLAWFRSNDKNRNGKVSAKELVGERD